MNEIQIPFVEFSVSPTMMSNVDFDVNQQLLILQQSNWLNSTYLSPTSEQPEQFTFPKITETLLAEWKTYVNAQEAIQASIRRNTTDLHNQTQSKQSFVAQTEHGAQKETEKTEPNQTQATCSETEAPNSETRAHFPDINPEKTINRIGSQFGLNKKQ